MASTNPTQKALQACQACRRLKRKCSKDRPSCGLCVRLGKRCEYSESTDRDGHPTSPTVATNRSDHRNQVGAYSHSPSDASNTALSQGPDKPFPISFFLDTEFFTPLSSNGLSCTSQPCFIRQSALTSLELDHKEICEGYLSTVHQWLPIISRKRLMTDVGCISSADVDADADADVCLPILLLCMKLCTTSLYRQHRDNTLYALATSLCSAAESAGFVSLHLIQCLVVLSVFELFHAIYPAAYLTIGRAARMGILMGIHDRNRAQHLFQAAEIWTLREEQRRTWWAIFVLDRFVNVETSGMPFAAPEPCFEELLPINDVDWDQGTIVGSEHLYAKFFSSSTATGSFAMICRASHMLSKVCRHREAKKTLEDAAQLLSEAKQLHCALVALHSSLELNELSLDQVQTTQAPRLIALAICTSARFILYNMYGCNEPSGPAIREPLALELQNISLAGIRLLATSTSPVIARSNLDCPFLASCLYHAATECAWFIREDHEPEMYKALQDIVQGLRDLESCWGVAREYLYLLEKGGVLKLVKF